VSLRPLVAALGGAGALVACAAPEALEDPPAPPPEASALRVELLGGLASAPRWQAPEQVPVEIVLDATTSMMTPLPGRRVTRYDTALQLTARYLAVLPEPTPVALRVLGLTSGTECGTAVPIVGGGGAPGVVSLEQGLASLPPSRGESSLARTLEDARRSLSRSESGTGARVVVLSDFEPACGGDPCAAARGLVEAGIELEVVALGETPAPACLAELTSDALPPALARVSLPGEPGFRVERPTRPQAGFGRTLIGLGRAGGESLTVPPGRVVVTVELEPPVTVGPLDLVPGLEATVRVLEFPSLDPPVREVWVEERARTDDASGVPGEP
jgi:hypothetical protein